MSEKKALVIGAGIGGLCVAVMLQQQGWEVVLFEKKPELSEFGAGIVLAANAMGVLERLGVASLVREEGAKVGIAEIRTWSGKLITSLPTHKLAEKYGTYSYLIHRASLQSILYRSLADNTKLKFNKKLIGTEQKEGAVIAKFEDGTEESGTILIGADGIHSSIRSILFGESELRYSGFTAYRGVTTYENKRYVPEEGGGFEAWGRGKRFGYSHLGQNRIFWFAAINAPATQRIPQDQMKAELLRNFKGWYAPIEVVIQATEDAAILNHDIYDRKPLERWSQGRITLLGDAAHPMLPNLGQGGAQAMEDALILAQCLTGNIDDIQGLHLYEQKRIPRTSRIVRQSRKMGRMVQLDHPLAMALRNQVLSWMPDRHQMNRLHWLLDTNM
ncbi:FAD-dependent oxidoreductase [Paenibacillus sp. GCM10027628]|uniref:FAD-dependent oxidoreductase n=1 Tax=Paenibacillus sp. GCM10027628 TaxID=3273413 RepID=UPI003632FE1B